ncbi:MAG: glycosyltransferase family 4 protein [Chitinophagales bacterium]|nr:glycosyltransferase family 4 protein [Bacteroidota bacterium]MCB9043992.1 glycosyltransferase family 4 protein [Chitinophagales bacterium]
MKPLRILMLGWEFPPLINGGLGIACYGMAKALSKHAEVTVILPRTDPEFRLQNVQLTGIGNLSVEEIKRNFSQREIEITYEEEYEQVIRSYRKFSEVQTIPASLSPYGEQERQSQDIQLNKLIPETSVQKVKVPKTKRLLISDEAPPDEQIANDIQVFNEGKLYDEDLTRRVFNFAQYASRIALQYDFDIIHAHDWMTALAGIEIKKLTGKPLAWHAHALMYDRGGPSSRGMVYDIETHVMRTADAIIPVSFYTGKIIQEHLGVPQNKIYPIHNGADPVEVFHVKKRFPEKLVLFLGRITGQKGPEIFLEIADRVLLRHSKVRFVMAGDGDKLKRLIEEGAYKQVGNKFHFTGFLGRDNVNKLLAMADIYCMPSVSEPFGLSALEAAQFGVPMVISKQSGAAEVLSGALTADHWDVYKMADQIVELLENEKLCQDLVQQNFEDIKHLTWDDTAQKLMKVFEKLCYVA